MRQRRLCALTQYTGAINGRAHSSPISPATHLSHSFRDALPNYTCFILLRFGFGNKNYLCPSPPLSLSFSTSLSLSQGYFPVPREPLLFVWHFWKLPRALPSPTAGHAPAARDTAGVWARGDICICELNFWARTSAAWIGEVKWI